MAIVEMQKIGIYAEKKHRKGVLEFLQEIGAMEVDFSKGASEMFDRMDTSSKRQEYEKTADNFDHCIELVGKYAPAQKGSLLNFEMNQVTRDKYEDVVGRRNEFYKIQSRLFELEKQLSESKATIIRKQNHIAAIEPWKSLGIPLNTEKTRRTAVLIGTVPGSLDEASVLAAAMGPDTEEGAKPVDAVTADILNLQNQMTYVCIMCPLALEEQVEENIRKIGFSRVPFLTHRVPQAAIDKRLKDIEAEEKKISDAEKEIAGYGELRDEFKIISDYYRTRAEKYRVLGTLPQTAHIFVVEGWIPKEKTEDITKVLEEKFDAVVEKLETREDDDEPVVLRNNKFSASMEGVLESYGLPRHGRVDPTTVMSFFYCFFFGMMLSDAAYGIIMSIATAIILIKQPRMADGMKKMMKMFFWCGLSTAFWGFMFGGFFGDAIDVIAKTFCGYTGETPILKPLWFAPLDNPMRLLVWCLLFGIIHLFAGLAMKGYELLKAGDVKGFISDICSWYLFIGGLILILLPTDIFGSIAGQTFVFPSWLSIASKVMTILGALIILIMSGRGHKNWGIRIALGAYDIYGVTSWLSDVLSYSRLLALGLATGVIASVVNMMAAMVGNSVFGIIVFVIVFIFGHTLNLAINLLGAYVHTNRLQYVEFFGKFYDAGGRIFKPFKTVNKYIEIKED